ncbi:MAG: amidase [Solirubrobacteraceae bacterium]|nr:amidase [Solirubrobacteraceae bacterium]
MTALHELGASDLRREFLALRLSPVEALEAAARRIEQTSGANACAALALDRAMGEAREAEQRYARRDADGASLLGVPILVKDLIDTAGVRTTYGSRMFAEHVPSRDAPCVERVRAQGAVLVGKTHLFEFAWGITSENQHLGACLNPWDPARTAGGSSSGSAVALALRQAPLALGTDTAGSIRIPAAFCGVSGLKPTFGRVGTDGVFPLAPSFDHVGPMARSPADLELLMAALGAPVGDPEGAGTGGRGGRPVRIGVWHGPAEAPLDPDVGIVLERAAETLATLGHEVRPQVALELPRALEAFVPLQLAEALDVHRRSGLYPERRGEYAPAIVERLERAEQVTLERYLAAEAIRRDVIDRMRRLFDSCELMLSAVSPVAPPRRGEEDSARAGDARGLREAVLAHTVPQSLAGLPTAVVRGGWDRLGLPVGLQLSGPQGADGLVLSVADAFFRATEQIQEPWPSGTTATAPAEP